MSRSATWTKAFWTRGVKEFKDRGETVTGYQDIRKLLENPDIDVVSLATPNHWHALGAIWAVQAGKDVYVEKPVSHNIFEGRQDRRRRAQVQPHGPDRFAMPLQRRLAGSHRLAEGRQPRQDHPRARAVLQTPRQHRQGGATRSSRPSIDYDLWCGPAPKEAPLMRKKLHYDWHWVWPTGNGDLGNQGVHQMDIARWVLGESELAPTSFSIGGRLGYEDDGTTPNTQIVLHNYRRPRSCSKCAACPPAAPSDKMDKYHGASIGVVVDCEGGRVVIPSYDTAIVFDKEGKEIKKFSEGGDHFANFIKAVRSRKHTDLNCRHPGRPSFRRALPHRQYFLSPGQDNIRPTKSARPSGTTRKWPKCWAAWTNTSPPTRWT